MKQALYLSAAITLVSGVAYGNPDNPADMEQYIVQCPNAMAARADLKSVEGSMNDLQSAKTGDENQDLINQCKAVNYAKTIMIPKLTNYTKALDECSRNGFPILKRMVFNMSMTVQQLQNSVRSASAECN